MVGKSAENLWVRTFNMSLPAYISSEIHSSEKGTRTVVKTVQKIQYKLNYRESPLLKNHNCCINQVEMKNVLMIQFECKLIEKDISAASLKTFVVK